VIDSTVAGLPISLRQRVLTTLAGRFARGVRWNLIAVLFNQGSTFVTNVIVANVLGRTIFGQYAITLSSLQAVGGLAGLGMGYTATRYVAEFRARQPERAGRVLGMCLATASGVSLLVALLLAGEARHIATRFFHHPEIADLLRLGASAVVFAAVSGCINGVLGGLEAYVELGWAGVVSGVAYTALGYVGAVRWQLSGAVVALALSGAAQTITLGFFLRHVLRRVGLAIRFSGLVHERRIITGFALPSVMSGLTAIPALWFAQAELARQPNGLADVAIYSASFSFLTVVLFVPNVVNSVGMSLINHARGEGDAARYRHVFKSNLAITMALAASAAAVMAVASPLLLGLFGRDFRTGFPVLLLLLVATLPEAWTIGVNQILQSNSRIWSAVAIVNTPRDLLIVVLAITLVPHYGPMGLALAYLSGRLLGALTTSWLAWRVGLQVDARVA
jgi:O-antigen/teichoic acid export membrane protein